MLGPWDLGNARTLDQLIDFTGVDARKYEITKSSCGKLEWVPFDEEDMDEDGDPMVVAYERLETRRRRQQHKEEEDRHLARSSGSDPLLAAEEKQNSERMHRALFSLTLSCISLLLLIAWWWEGNRTREIPP
jgi:hypothetical protein